MYHIRTINKLALLLSAVLWANTGGADHMPIDSGKPDDNFASAQAVYVAMPDGVRLAADIYLPQEARSGARVPTMLHATRYWRSQETAPPQTEINPVAQAFIDLGYAVILLDVRGTGASFGHRATEFSVSETRDLVDIVNWIANQPWSNGSVGAIGYSYAGNTAENVSFGTSTSLKAVIPLFTDFDLFTSILMPGGLKNKTIITQWGNSTAALDRNKAAPTQSPVRIIGVKPVEKDLDRALLERAIKDHGKNRSITQIFSDVTFRDDVNFAESLDDSGHNMVSPSNFGSFARKNAIPAFHMGSWMDASTASGVLARFAALDTPSLYVIGAWNHGAELDANPYLPPNTQARPALEEQYIPIFEFLSRTMSGNGVQIKPQLYYFTMGENVWRSTQTWPPKGSSNKRLYFAEKSQLLEHAPTTLSGKPSGATQYSVDFGHGTGTTSRWTTQLGGGDVNYGDRRSAAEQLLNFTSKPLQADLEITGHPVIELAMSSTTADGAVIAYLQDIAPDGTVRLLTEGQLRLIHRKVSEDKPPYPVVGPHHSFLRKDGVAMPPGETERVGFALLPTSVLIKKGHRIRIAIAGHDKDVFERIPVRGIPLYEIQHNSVAISYLDLPVVEREHRDGTEKLLDLFD
ncbi:MAG: CocE/NonD family hydrolase [Gammaproteobacteria bacterium]|nr:CocE/NonD family hydrolase [Gammaproteobacteria bacterium]